MQPPYIVGRNVSDWSPRSRDTKNQWRNHHFVYFLKKYGIDCSMFLCSVVLTEYQNMCNSIENNRGRIGGRWWAAQVLRGALPAAHRGGDGEMSASSLSRPTENCAPLIYYGSTVAPEEVSHRKISRDDFIGEF